MRVDLVPNVMHECVRKKVKGAIIITADFAETGRDGQKLQQEVIDIARPGGVRVVGPNCMGLLNAAHDLNTFPELPPKGKIGFISQSGSICHFLIQIAKKKGYGLSKLISVGNQADLDVADFLEYLAADTQTQSIGMYLEGFQDGRKFFPCCKRDCRDKTHSCIQSRPASPKRQSSHVPYRSINRRRQDFRRPVQTSWIYPI